MRSIRDWFSALYGPERNPFLQLPEGDRKKLGARTMVFMVLVAVFFALWRWLD